MSRKMPMGPGGAVRQAAFAPKEKPKNFMGTVRRLAGWLRPFRLQIFAAFAATLLGTGASLYSPKILGQVATELFNGRLKGQGALFSEVGHLLALLAGLYLANTLLTYFQQVVMARVSQRAVYALRQRAAEKILRLPMSYFDTHPHGEVLSRFVNDFDNISSTLQQTLTQILSAGITFFGVIAMMLTISPLMTLAVVVTLPASFLVTRSVVRRSQAQFAARQRNLGALNGHIEEMYTGHLAVKAFGQERRALEQFDEVNERLFAATWRSQFMTSLIMPLVNFIGNIGYVFVSVFGGLLVIQGRIQIGDILAFIQYARQFRQPISQLSSISNTVQLTVASAERVLEILDEEEEPGDPQDARPPRAPEGDIRFRSVGFRYTDERPLMEGLTLDIPAGKTAAIVGPTGAGKTTLVNLLMRFYDVRGGQITVDGRDIRSFGRGDLRRLFGMVLQDTWLFHGTIHENIAYGRPEATEEEVVEAARAAQADGFIRALPQGYATLIDEEAANLSQGQRQLLTIARAVLVDPPVLILDEATSNVDTRTEILIQKATRHLMSNRTSCVIAHRLSTVREADVILVMDRGSVVEQGTHEELLARGGLYADLYASQFEGQEMRVATP